MEYDIVTIGGGLAGSALAKAMADKGARVAVLEREEEFRDRIRGEGMHPWGVAEARALGIYDLLLERCAHEARFWVIHFMGQPTPARDLVATTPHDAGELDFYHPEMQETLIQAAADAGADVKRGVSVEGVDLAGRPKVKFRSNGGEDTVSARLVVGSDGRNSKTRRWGGFGAQFDEKRLAIAGVLYEGLQAEEDRVQLAHNPEAGLAVLVFPLGRERFRTYVVYDKKRSGPRHLSGKEHVSDFAAASEESLAPKEWWAGASVAGPLAEFEGAPHWVDQPYRDGLVLIGDAASASDPSWGSGLSLTLRDVRLLRDKLVENDDWEKGARAYAREHDEMFARQHTVEQMFMTLLFDAGPEADARRARALPALDADPVGKPDLIGLGPDSPCDDEARRRFFVED